MRKLLTTFSVALASTLLNAEETNEAQQIESGTEQLEYIDVAAFNEAALAAQLPVYEVPKYNKTIDLVRKFENDPRFHECANIHAGKNVTINRYVCLEVLMLVMYPEFITSHNENERFRELAKELKEEYASLIESDFLRQNCYAFAVGDTQNPIYHSSSPGERHDGRIVFGPENIYAVNMAVAATKDGLRLLGDTTGDIKLDKNERLVVLYVNTYKDYHWLRVDQNKAGQLVASGKMGLADAATQHVIHDINKDLINLSFSNDPNNGYNFACFFAVPQEGINVGRDAFFEKNGVWLENLQTGKRHPIDLETMTLINSLDSPESLTKAKRSKLHASPEAIEAIWPKAEFGELTFEN